jgi:hypothetical protein
MTDSKPPERAEPAPKQDYEFHELAGLFPLIEGDEFDAFVDTFRRQGLLNPITLYQGRIARVQSKAKLKALQEANPSRFLS